MIGMPPDPASLPPRWRPPAELDLGWHDGATLLPLEADPDARIPFRLGGYDGAGVFLDHTAHRRGSAASAPPALRPAEEEWPQECVYGGMLWDHFGHFLLEGLTRAWALRELPGRPILWHRRAAHARLASWQADILEMIGLAGREHRVVARPVRVGRLAVAEQGLVMWRHFHPRQIDALAAHGYRAPETGRRVWLSRSGLPERLARVEGEEALEALLAGGGWIVLRPETMPVAAQLAALETAEVIAGFAGSAFHGLVLGRDVRARIVIVTRGERLNPNYTLIGIAKGLDQVSCPALLDHLGGKGALAQHRLADPAALFAALQSTAP